MTTPGIPGLRLPPARGTMPSSVEIEQAAKAMHAGTTVTIPGAVAIALISAAASIGVGYFSREKAAGVQAPVNVATTADIREVREDLRQLRAEFRQFMADVEARQRVPGPPAAARP